MEIIFKNQPQDQVATKIPFAGNIDAPNTNLWYAILHILRNAFVQALQPAIDNEITIASVDNSKAGKKNFIQKIFGKKEGKSKSKKKG